jgi:hypothetical protein
MASSRERANRVVVLIGAFKLIKSALLIAIGAAALSGVPAAALERALHASRWTGALSGHRTVRDAVVKLLSMDARTMRDLEIYELARHGGAGELAALAINGAIAAYLVRRRLQARAPGAHTRAPVSRFRAA